MEKIGAKRALKKRALWRRKAGLEQELLYPPAAKTGYLAEMDSDGEKQKWREFIDC